MEISNSSLSSLVNSLNGSGGASDAAGVSGVGQPGGLVGGLPVGAYISGQITDILGKNVMLTLSDGNQMGARLASDMNVNIGDSLILQVKENGDNKMVLKTVSAYDSRSNLISNALKSANLPESSKNIAVVNELIKSGQPLNKQTIQNVLYGTQLSPGQDLSDVIDLVKHGIEMTKDNLTQYANYKELNYNMANEMKNFASGLESSLSMINEENFTAAKDLLTKAMDVISTKYSQMNIAQGNLQEGQGADGNILHSQTSAIQSGDALNSGAVSGGESSVLNAENASLNSSEIDNLINNSALNQNAINGEELLKPDNSLLSAKNINIDNLNNLIKEAFSGTDAEKLTGLIKNGSSFEDILKELSNLLKDNEGSALNLIKSKDFTNLLKESLQNRWSLDPQKILGSKEEKSELIKEMYSKIVHDADKLQRLFEGNDITKALANNLANVKSNASFINNLNNIMSYVQIPLKFNDSNSHGDLYVYNNKKQKYIPGDLITAHLFLELDYLGATDVHISMKGKSTSTNFVLDDDLSMQIVEEHMPMLLERLEAKGYSCSYKVETLTKKTESDGSVSFVNNPLEEVLSKDTSVINVKRYNFDVRA